MPTPRKPAPVEKPVVLTIAGSDSGGGAGIQADLKTIEACGGFGTSVLTAVTAQNTLGVESSYVLPIEEIEAQLDAVHSDFDVRAAKTGMLATAEVIETVTGYARQFDGPLVVDPVMVAASGDRLLEPEAESAYEGLLAEATLVTPNADEAAVLTDVDPTDESEARQAGEAIRGMGCQAALVKGGHLPGNEVRDVLVTADGTEVVRHPRVDTDATHGSGCTLASAIATRLAHGESVPETVRSGVDLLGRAVRYHHDVGEGPGAVHHLVALRNEAARHETAEAVESIVERFVARTVESADGRTVDSADGRTVDSADGRTADSDDGRIADSDDGRDVEGTVAPLVPEVGMNVIGATPYAEEPGETAAVEGRITRTLSGVKPNRGVRFGASSHVARFLLAAREFDPDLRFAVNCRYDEAVESALDALDGPVGSYDRSAEPEAVKAADGSTMQWGARRAFESVGTTPVAVTDPGDVGKEPMTKLLAADAGVLVEHVGTVLENLRSRRTDR